MQSSTVPRAKKNESEKIDSIREDKDLIDLTKLALSKDGNSNRGTGNNGQNRLQGVGIDMEST